jgi:O-antigen/teichoic acid export membrane protein
MRFSLKTKLDSVRATSVRHNVLANLGGQGLSAIVSLLCVPIYLRILGIGGYGLLGIWMTIETLASLLDFGLSPTMTRELATYAAQPAHGNEARDFVRTLETGYWCLALIIGLAIMSAAPLISRHWIHSSELSPAAISTALKLIGVLIACRWPLSFYAGGINGLERQVLLAWITTGAALVRSLGGVAVLLWIASSVTAFFAWQIAVNLALSLALMTVLWRCLPGSGAGRFSFTHLRRVGRFAGGTAGIAIVSMALSDLDKLVVSKKLPLEIFGYYSLGWRVAGTLYMVSSAIYQAIFPALARLAEGRDTRLAAVYHRGCQLMAILVIPAAATVVFFGRELIFAWTGSAAVAAKTYPLAALMTAGTALQCLATVPFALQLSAGWTTLAFYSNLCAMCVSVPALLILTNRFGAIGAASVWLLVNFSYLFTQVPITHYRLLRGEQLRWYMHDTFAPLAAAVIAAAAASLAFPATETRFAIIMSVACAYFIGAVAAALATPVAREQVAAFLSRYRTRLAPQGS